MTDRLDRVPPGLATFVFDVRSALDLDAAEARAQPDFEDVLARTDLPRSRSGDVPCSGGAPDEHLDRIPTGLAHFVDDVRAVVEGAARERRMRSVPPLRALRSRPRWLPRAIAISGIAAAAGLAALWLAGLGSEATVVEPDRTSNAALAEHEPAPSEHEASHAAPPPKPRRGSTTAGAELPELDEIEGEIEIFDETEPPEQPATRAGGAPTLDDLEALAAEAWARGDLQEAERALEQIARRGGRSRQAELAYGDLFTIAHQRRNAARKLALYDRYLERFPRGRYADDARAGRCRLTDPSRRASCWTRYLADWPHGSHRDEARSHADAP